MEDKSEKILKIKKEFPIFEHHKDLVYLDNAATTQKPQKVIEALTNFYQTTNANVHRGIYELSEMATDMYESARHKVSDYIGGEGGYTIFTSGTTESLNMAAEALSGDLAPGDVVLASEVEHHSNMLPWQKICKESGSTLKYISVGEDGLITQEALEKVLESVKPGKIRIVAITHVSNVTGQITPLNQISKALKNHSPGARVVVDGAQAVAHTRVDLSGLDIDLYAFSGHKMYGPMGVGVLWGRKELLDALEPVKRGGGIVSSVDLDGAKWMDGEAKWEAGTPNVVGAVGLGAAVDFLESLDMAEIWRQEGLITDHLTNQLREIPEIKLLGVNDNNDNRVGVVSLYSPSIHSHDISQVLASKDIAVRAGHHCVHPYHKKFELSGTARVSIGMYNSKQDIDKALQSIKRAVSVFG